MEFDHFLTLSNEEIAKIVKESGEKVLGIPFNGTRRWLFLEHFEATQQDFIRAYLGIVGDKMMEILQLLFDHGISTVLTPLFGLDLMKKGSDYLKFMGAGLTWFVKNEKWREFFTRNQIKVKIYGDYKKHFNRPEFKSVLKAFQELESYTAPHAKNRLFIGIFGQECAETIAEIGIEFHQKYHRIPTKDEIIGLYYGESVKNLDLFIGFDRPCEFDMPLIADGSEHLYFTVCPTPYLDKDLLRHILFDHLYMRHLTESPYEQVPQEEWGRLSSFYRENRNGVLGVGRQGQNGHFWYPHTQIKPPKGC